MKFLTKEEWENPPSKLDGNNNNNFRYSIAANSPISR